MLGRTIPVLLIVASLVGCASTRGGFVDEALDKSLYRADTKAERLLRYFEVQALLVNFAAHAAGNAADRNAIALANAVASAELIPLIDCLENGPGDGILPPPTATLVPPATPATPVIHVPPAAPAAHPAPAPAADAAPVPAKPATFASLFNNKLPDADVRTAYCSFFDSRMINYESLLLSLLRQVVQEDIVAANLKATITGANIFDFARFVAVLTTAASTYFRDERILSAFKADALELQVFVWSGLEYSKINQAASADADVESIRPERADMRTLADTVRLENAGSLRPTIKVWHFLEVYGFMLSSCQALNDDTPVKGLGSGAAAVKCSTNLKS